MIDANLLFKNLGIKSNKDDIGLSVEKKEKYFSFNTKLNVKVAGVTNKNGKEVHKKIQLRSIDSCRFVASSLHIPVSNLCNTNKIQCDEGEGVWS